MFTWNEYLYALSLTESNAATLPVTFTKFIGWGGISFAEMMATVVITMLPIIVASLFLQRYLVKGLTMGSVK